MNMISKLTRLRKQLPTLSPRFHLAVGLSSLLSSVVLTSIFAGFSPKPAAEIARSQLVLAESVAGSAAVLLADDNLIGMREVLRNVVERDSTLDSVVLRRERDNSQRVFSTTPHSETPAAAVVPSASIRGSGPPVSLVLPAQPKQHDTGTSATARSAVMPPPPSLSAASPPLDHDTAGSREGAAVDPNVISVPLHEGRRLWGKLEFHFIDESDAGVIAWLQQAPFSQLIFVGLLSFPLFYLYLGKMLKQLDPSAAVPGRVRSALDTIAEALLVIDAKYNIVLANTAFAELTNRQAESLIGVEVQSLQWVTDPTDADADKVTGLSTSSARQLPWQQALESGEPTRGDMIGFLDPAGKARKFIVNCSPVLGATGRPGGVLISMDDVTLLEEKEVLLRQSMREAESANHAKSAFLSNMSHEIRTPMTAILGFTEVLRRGSVQSESERQNHLKTIHSSGQHLLKLINDVLDLSKVESGSMDVEQIPTAPVAIARDVIQVLNVKAREKSISLDLSIKSDMPECFDSDPARLQQILTNLVGNAIKFTEKGGVIIGLSHRKVKGVHALEFSIADTGIGMSEAQQATIFDAFTQADATITRRFGGTGLGLSISRQLAQAMGGDVVVSSQEGRGSTFTVNLPAGNLDGVSFLTPAELLKDAPAAPAEAALHWEFPPTQVLVVDDAPENRELLRLILGELGIGVELAENGQQAVDAVASRQFDAVLMDIQMPVMDGYEAVAAMRKQGIVNPILALTANAMKGYEVRLLEAGFSHYVTKPIDLAHLTSLLGRLLGGRQVTQEALIDNQLTALPTSTPPETGFNASTTARSSLQADEQKSHTVPADTTTAFPTLPSTLAADNPAFAPIVERFLAQLVDRLAGMQRCHQEAAWQELADEAHWLKGSGGTMGFMALVTPARQLELAAKAGNAMEAGHALDEIEALANRLVVKAEPISDAASITNVTFRADDIKHEADSSIVSSLPLSNPRFLSIVEQFMPKLQTELEQLARAVGEDRAEDVARLAHWLKGSAGNMGFAAFVEPAARLEASAQAGNTCDMQQYCEAVQILGRQVQAGWEQSAPPLDRSA